MATVAMEILEWAPEYALDIPEIDREHQDWFEVINRLHAAMLDGKGPAYLRTVFAEVAKFSFAHFAHEEELMVAANYPGYWDHVQRHNELRETGRAFLKRFENGEFTVSIEVMQVLSRAIVEQILTADRPMGDYMKTHGPAAASARR